MFLKKPARLRGTLSFRLTLWYAGVFTVSTFMAFLVSYFLIASVIHERRNEDLLDDVEEFAALWAAGGIERVKAEMELEAASDGVDTVFFRLLSPAGKVIASTDMTHWGSVGKAGDALEKLSVGADPVFETMSLPEQEYPVGVVFGKIGQNIVLQLGESLEEDEEFLEILREVFFPTIAIVALLAALVGWLMAKRALTGVEDVTQIALQISQGAFDKRVPIKNRGDEIERLASTFNYMVERIDLLIKEIREMTDNIAHDLRSPLTRIRGVAEMTLTTTTSVDEFKTMAASTIEECDQLLGIVNTMLDISESESGAVTVAWGEVDISRVTRQACELFKPIADEEGIKVVSVLPADCIFSGDLQRLQRMVANLLDNALKFTPPGGTVTVSVAADEKQIAISVKDTGVGISEKDLPHIFKRFYRCDDGQAQPGVGLGLSLVRAIARSHGGDVGVTSLPGTGSTFTISLPRSALSDG